ncbi:MAG: CoB--CoM heterodisulfide reductase iron-sulfur subunit B family protein, partial [Nitrospinae bacterium]|nr:CoB--CoM heterodisulfide reductase iron-sulfur subunit B family protein [Nitrospinota bacterium]
MRYALFTGCVAKGAARELYSSTIKMAELLDIRLDEMTSAACCGAGVISDENEILSDTINARTFAIAEDKGLNIMNICGTCQGVMKKAEYTLKKNNHLMDEVNKVLKSRGYRYRGRVKIRHLLNILIEDYGLDKIKEKVTRPLNGLKIAPFYGCYIIRPSDLSDLNDPDDPTAIEDVITTLGGEPIDYEGRLKCCGFPYLMMNKQGSLTMAGKHLASAKEKGADCVVTPCPLCHLNMDPYQPDI